MRQKVFLVVGCLGIVSLFADGRSYSKNYEPTSQTVRDGEAYSTNYQPVSSLGNSELNFEWDAHAGVLQYEPAMDPGAADEGFSDGELAGISIAGIAGAAGIVGGGVALVSRFKKRALQRRLSLFSAAPGVVPSPVIPKLPLSASKSSVVESTVSSPVDTTGGYGAISDDTSQKKLAVGVTPPSRSKVYGRGYGDVEAVTPRSVSSVSISISSLPSRASIVGVEPEGGLVSMASDVRLTQPPIVVKETEELRTPRKASPRTKSRRLSPRSRRSLSLRGR